MRIQGKESMKKAENRLPKNTKARYNIEIRQAADQDCKKGCAHMSEQGTMLKDRIGIVPAPASHRVETLLRRISELSDEELVKVISLLEQQDQELFQVDLTVQG